VASDSLSAATTDAQKKSAVETILESTQEWNQSWNRTYMDLEASIMERIHSSNKRRFRGILLSTLIVITWFFATFGSKIKQTLTRQTADIAKETLENKSLQIQTQELARAVVQTILNDKEVTLRAAVFVREALSTPETKDALLNLLYDLIQHPKTQDALAQVTKNVIAEVVNDKVISRLNSRFCMSIFMLNNSFARLHTLGHRSSGGESAFCGLRRRAAQGRAVQAGGGASR
jgi:cell division protein FtsB